MATVETRGIKKHYGNVVAGNGFALATKDGEFLVLLGPSGCGKTTLLRMIAGFETPSAGELVIAGEVVNDLPPRARKIAMVFQSYALYPHMTVFKNIAFPLKAQRVAKSAIPERGGGGGVSFRHAPSFAPKPTGAVGGGAPTGGLGAGRGGGAGSLPASRATLQSGCAIAGLGSRRAPTISTSNRHDDD